MVNSDHVTNTLFLLVQGEASKRLARIKAGSKKTFKFRKTRRRDHLGGGENGQMGLVSPEGTIVEQSPPLPTATATTQTPTSMMTTAEAATAATAAAKQSTTSLASKTFGPLKPVSLTATVIKRAKQKVHQV